MNLHSKIKTQFSYTKIFHPFPFARNIPLYVDILEAPKGYQAVSINYHFANGNNTNKCTKCDWRKDCMGNLFSCMSYNRKDGCNVIFEKEGNA